MEPPGGPPVRGRAPASVVDPRVSFGTGDAAELPQVDAWVDAVVSGLVLNFLPDGAAAVAEWRRVVAPQGIVAACVWDYAEGMHLVRRLWDAAGGAPRRGRRRHRADPAGVDRCTGAFPGSRDRRGQPARVHSRQRRPQLG